MHRRRKTNTIHAAESVPAYKTPQKHHRHRRLTRSAFRNTVPLPPGVRINAALVGWRCVFTGPTVSTTSHSSSLGCTDVGAAYCSCACHNHADRICTGPGNFLEGRKLLPLLTSSSPDYPSFHVVMISLPGFGFSEAPKKPGFAGRQYAEVL